MIIPQALRHLMVYTAYQRRQNSYQLCCKCDHGLSGLLLRAACAFAAALLVPAFGSSMPTVFSRQPSGNPAISANFQAHDSIHGPTQQSGPSCLLQTPSIALASTTTVTHNNGVWLSLARFRCQ